MNECQDLVRTTDYNGMKLGETLGIVYEMMSREKCMKMYVFFLYKISKVCEKDLNWMSSFKVYNWNVPRVLEACLVG